MWPPPIDDFIEFVTQHNAGGFPSSGPQNVFDCPGTTYGIKWDIAASPSLAESIRHDAVGIDDS
eukprot:1293683-Pyramimonas_sp.AAC.1